MWAYSPIHNALWRCADAVWIFPLPLHPSVRPLAQPCLLVVRRVNFLTINAWHNKIE